jgi:hypothetical protein
MWSKPWSLSAKDLKIYLTEYMGAQKGDECFKYIVDSRKQELVATDFSFTRTSLKLDTEDANV